MLSRTAASRAASSAVTSTERSARPSATSAMLRTRSRRRACTVASQSVSPRAAVRGPSSRGLSRVGRPPPSSIAPRPPLIARVDDGPFAFRVAGDVDLAAEGDRAGGQGFGERGLAAADDAGEQHVRVGEHSALVEHPGVEAERRAGPGVGADEQPVGAEPGLGEERVRAAEHLGGGAMRRERQPPVAAQRVRAGLAAGGKVAGGVPLGPLGFQLPSLGGEHGAAGFGFDVPRGAVGRPALRSCGGRRGEQRAGAHDGARRGRAGGCGGRGGLSPVLAPSAYGSWLRCRVTGRQPPGV